MMVLPVASAGPIFHASIRTEYGDRISRQITSRASKLPSPLTREVPGDDLADDADGLVAGVDELRLSGLDGLALDLVRPAGVVAEAGDDGLDVGLCPEEGLAVVEGLDGGKRVDVVLDELGEAGEELAALRTGHGEPVDGLEGVVCSLNCGVDVLGGTLADLGDQLARRGVDDTAEGLEWRGVWEDRHTHSTVFCVEPSTNLPLMKRPVGTSTVPLKGAVLKV